ncbi:MAG: ATP-grasp domain-containing protein [Spirochaetales bacterium]|nr:ATP-grasp domain-containing protein [Spirochaetales bacterium]
MANVALLYNLIHEEHMEKSDKPIDFIAEYDTHETVDAVKTALEAGGHDVILIEADENAYYHLHRQRNSIDMVFNIAEGIGGESRESEVPVMCEMLGIPYTGSGPLTLALCLDKARTKEILMYHQIPTPRFRIYHNTAALTDMPLEFPLIVKLAAEGSSMGLTYDSVVDNYTDLKVQVNLLLEKYKRPVIVEEFIEGREFGIPLIGNDPPITLPIMEFIFHGKKSISLFIPDKPFDIYKKRNQALPQNEVTNECPANISESLKEKLNTLAVKAYKALGCKDWCRLEIRLNKNEDPYVIELNPIAGIDPSYRFARSAEAGGMSFDTLINKILDYAQERYGMTAKA